MNQNARALKILDRIQAATGLTECGKNALLQLVNPFSDFEFQKCGYFDTDESASVVQTVKFSSVVTKPPGLAAGANWDCNLYTLPLLGSVSGVTAGTYVGNGLYQTGSGGSSFGSFGLLNAVTGPAGVPLNLTSASSVTSGYHVLGPVANSDSSSSYLDGVSRVIGLGFEVHNTTAPLYLQGSVAVYRYPQTHYFDRQARGVILATGPNTAPTSLEYNGTIDSCLMNDAPSSLASAMLLSGTRQWEAKDGCMVIPTLVDPNLPAQRRSAVFPLLSDHTPVTITYPGGAAATMFDAVGQGVNLLTAATPAGMRPARQPFPNKFTGFNSGGAYFSGLSETTTLTVNLIVYLERFPTTSEADLVVLAQPSPKADPIARDLYNLIMREMPIGVKVGDNASGDWFFQGLSAVSKFLKPAISMVGGPLGLAGNIINGAVGDWAESKLRNPAVAPGSTWTPAPKPLPPPLPKRDTNYYVEASRVQKNKKKGGKKQSNATRKAKS